MEQGTKWKWRDGEKSYKEFTLLPTEQKQEYVRMLEALPIEEVSSTDEIILNRFGNKKQNIKFLEL